MTIDPWIGLASLVIVILGALMKHISVDARRAQRLSNLENRVKKFDGIDANGH